MSISTVLLRGLGPGGSPSALLTRGLVDPPDVIESALSEVSTVDSSLVGAISSELDLSEGSSVTDAISENLIAEGLIEESSLASDTLTTSLYSEHSVNESISADGSLIANTGSASNLTEASSLADSSSTFLQQYPGVVEDSLVSDSLDTSTTVVRDVFESSLLSDTLTLTHEKSVAISENNAVNDDVTITSQAASALSEEIPLTESLSVHVIKNNAVSESSTVLDTNAVGKTTYPIVSDSLNILENVSSRKVLATSISEGNSIVDALSEIRSHLANVSENSITVDFSSSEQTGVVGIIETTSVQDNLTIAGTWHIQLTEGSSVNSNEIGTGVVNLSVIENNAISDSLPLVTKAGYFDISESSVLEEVLSNTVALFDVIEESSYLASTISTRQILTLLNFAISNLQDDVVGCRFKIPVSQDEVIQENVRKFYDTDFYIVDDLVAYSKGPSTYLTPVYVVGLADYCCYYNPDTSSLVLEQKDIFDDIWVEVDSIPISQVPESISFTFDQNGYPAIVWEQNRNMWLYWYDSLMADTVITNKGPGYSPRIKLETFNEILQPVRTAILAYTSVDGQLVYLRQNERYETLHVLENEGVHGVASLSHTARNSLKLSYLIDRGLFDYNLENYSTERLGEWYGDNAVGRVDFLVDEFQIRSVIYGPTVEDRPIDGDHLVSNVTVAVIPTIIPYEAPHEKPVSGSHTISAMTVEVAPIVIRVPVDDEMRGPISHEYEPISLAITDIRIDYFHDHDYFSPISHEYEPIGLGFAYTKPTLLQAITAYSALPESDFTPATWGVLEGAIVAAQAVYDNGSATQNEIDIAGFNLDKARLSLDGRVVLLLHGNGADNSTVFTDSSGNGRTFTVGGNAKISTAWSQFGGASMLFDGSGDYIFGETIDDYRFANDFCVDFWVNKINNTGNQTLVDFREGGSLTTAPAFVIYTWQSAPVGTLAVYTTGANIMMGPVIEVGVPTHIEVSRTAGIMRMFVNGVLVRSVANSTNFTHGKVSIGSDANLASPLNGYIDELRIKRGGGHLENFTPPVAEYS